VTEYWHRLPRKVVESPPWRHSNVVWTWLKVAFCRWPFLSRVVGPDNL